MKTKPDIKWYFVEPGWYQCWVNGDSWAAICKENSYDCPPGKTWCAYVTKDTPPGDAQFKTLREAKVWVEKWLKKNYREGRK